jgi:O-antigen/teichoic acid export membrane protein
VNQLPAYLRRTGTTGLLNTAASALSVAVLLPLIIHRVGLESYGFFAMLAIFVGVAALLELGMSKALVYLVPRQPGSISELFSAAALLCSFGCGAFLAVLLALLAAGIPLFGSAVAGRSNLVWWLCATGAILVLINVSTALIRGALEGAYKMDVVNVGFAALTFTNYLAVFLASLFSDDPRVLLIASLSAFLLMLVVHVFVARQLLGLRLVWPSGARVREVRAIGWRSFLADAPGTLQTPALQYLFTLAARSGADYGVFDLALRIATLCATALSSLSTPFFAVVAGAARDSAVAVRIAIRKHIRLTLALGFVGWGVFALLGNIIIRWVVPEAPPDLFRVTLIILAGAALLAAFEPFVRMQLGLGRQMSVAQVRAAMLATSIALATLPVPWTPMTQFGLAAAGGCVAAALGFALLHRLEPWGRTASVAPPDTER